MQTADYAKFVELMKSPQAHALWPKQTVDDLLISTYWSALRDVAFATVERCMERHQQFGKFFPKPADLRPKVDRLPTVATPTKGTNEADARCIRNLEALRKRDPEAWKAEVAIRRGARVMATQYPGTTMYDTADNELRAMGAINGRWVVP